MRECGMVTPAALMLFGGHLEVVHTEGLVRTPFLAQLSPCQLKLDAAQRCCWTAAVSAVNALLRLGESVLDLPQAVQAASLPARAMLHAHTQLRVQVIVDGWLKLRAPAASAALMRQVKPPACFLCCCAVCP